MRLIRISHRRVAGIALAVLTLTMAVLVPAASGGSSQQSYYLALGDSMTYGFQPTKAGRPPAAFTTGFVDVVAAQLRKQAPDLQVVNYGCPGESTRTFVHGGCPAFDDHIRLHDAFRGS